VLYVKDDKTDHADKRRCKRFKERCDVEFASDGKISTGISRDFALNGLFIMTRDVKVPGTILDIALHLPNGAISKLRGKVRRFFETVTEKVIRSTDGMGIEIIEKDPNYLHFIRSLLAKSEKDSSCQTSQMDVEFIQKRHREPMPEKRTVKYDGRQRDFYDNEPQPLKVRCKEQEQHLMHLDSENKMTIRISFDEILLKHISERPKA